jgi:hypothetical protein
MYEATRRPSIMNISESSRPNRIILRITILLLFVFCLPCLAQAQWTTNADGSVTYHTNSEGKVGIGTRAPVEKLTVANGNPEAFGIYRDLDVASYGSNAGAIFSIGARSGTTFTPAARLVGVLEYPTSTGHLEFQTRSAGSLTTRMTIGSSGNVGIGTPTPVTALEVTGAIYNSAPFGFAIGSKGGVNRIITKSSGPTFEFINSLDTVSTVTARALSLGVSYETTDAPVNGLIVEGNVGIGTATPDANYKLFVEGGLKVTGNIAAKYQDVAEWVPSTQRLSAGTVVVLDTSKSNHVLASSSSYDTKVAGVISAQPGISLGTGGDDKVLVATTGRVKVNVDATAAPIHVGDLLVTSDNEGVAMKSVPIVIGGRKMHAPGTIVGKALEPLEKGTGEILVLLSLQ